MRSKWRPSFCLRSGGYYYGYWTLVVPLAWCAGFLLLALAAGRLDAFLQAPQTLHNYLGESHGGLQSLGGRALVRVAAIATLLGLGGALFAELGYTADLVQHLLNRSVGFRYLLMFCLLASALLYVLPGGFRAVVNTDAHQLPIAYIGLATFLAAIIYVGMRAGASGAQPTLMGIIAFATIALAVVAGIVTAEKHAASTRVMAVVVPLVSLALVAGAYLFGSSSHPGQPTNIPRDVWTPQPMLPLAALSLVLANGLWQFVDLSAFQRLTAIRLPSDKKSRTRSLRQAILWTALESPISWCIGIAIGVGLGQIGTFGGVDGAWTAYEQFLSSVARGDGVAIGLPEILRVGIIGLSLAGFIAIMLSSVDSLGSAVAFTTTSDLLGAFGKKKSTITHARTITVTVLITIWGLLSLWQALLSSQHDISAWLYTAYAMQLSLFGVCICALLSIRLAAPLALSSVAVGVLSSAVVGVLLVSRQDPNVFVVPPIIAVSTSFLIVLVPLIHGLAKRHIGAGDSQ